MRISGFLNFMFENYDMILVWISEC